MWPPMFDPLTNPKASPKPISGITQARIRNDLEKTRVHSYF
jgi:hypothetical protein